MKKITIISVLLLSTFAIMAQVRLPEFPNGPRQIGHLKAINGNTITHTPSTTHVRKFALNETLDNAGYLPPAGTFYLGMDADGKGIWLTGQNGVVGAWSDTIPCWIWTNNVSGDYANISYTNMNIQNNGSYLENSYYYADDKGNFYDSIVAAGGWDIAYAMGAYGDEGYSWQTAMPLQTVTWKDGTISKYMFLCKLDEPKADDAGLVVGGLPSNKTSDGLWPLTKAISTTTNGISWELKQSKDKDKYVHYYFGTDSMNIDTIGSSYIRVAPTSIIVNYERPQSPLFVKSIAIAIGADGNTVFNPTIKVNQPQVVIVDAATNDTIAKAEATEDDLIDLNQTFNGQLLTFSFEKDNKYGEQTQEGILIRNAFRVIITNFKNEDNFGIYAAQCSVVTSGAEIVYENGDTIAKNFEPYVMLNGIFPTFENYVTQQQFGSFERGVHGDTVDINMKSVSDPNYSYRAYYNAKDLADAGTFEYFSTFTPYDSVSRMWTMQLEYPDYIILGCDYDTNLGTEDNPITLWDYSRCFDLYIYATSTPVIGDEIKIAKAGREAIFKIVAIDGCTDIEQISAKQHGTHANKTIDRDGRIQISRGNTIYTILGQRIQ